MATNIRSKIEIKRDRVHIAEMYIQGRYQHEIAEELGLTQQQISYDLKAIQKEWKKNTTIALDDHKSKEIAKIDRLERTYWQAWEDSRQEGKTKSVKQSNTGVVRQIRTEDQYGDPRYLTGVQWCIEQRCKLLGMYQQADLSGIIINLISSDKVKIDEC